MKLGSGNVMSKGNSNTKDLHSKLFKLINIGLWVIFISCFSFLVFSYSNVTTLNNGFFRIKGFTILIWTVVSFFSAIVNSYSISYLKGFKYHLRFTWLTLGFTSSVMSFVASEHITFLLISWFLMGLFMARLIGADKDWLEAKAAAKFAQKWFTISTVFLSIGILLLAFSCNSFIISGLIASMGTIKASVLLSSSIFIIIAALIQSAIYPFHRWLLSAMTAPTPASALMHAGFVNGSGVLLTIFSTLIIASGTLQLLFIVGGFTAIIAQFTKLLQPNIKQKLACSTIAQMGFMIMQCGLGFFNAAIAHLILHGFYKAYLFLSAGEHIEASVPQENLSIKIKPLQIIVVLLYGIIGAYLFTTLTGKGNSMDSGIFLTLIVAITVGQFTYNTVKESNLLIWQKIILPPIVFFIGIGCYALIYNGVTKLMQDMPLVDAPSSLSLLQIILGALFLIGFFIMKLGAYRKLPWIYVKLLNVSQPNRQTILMYKNKS